MNDWRVYKKKKRREKRRYRKLYVKMVGFHWIWMYMGRIGWSFDRWREYATKGTSSGSSIYR